MRLACLFILVSVSNVCAGPKIVSTGRNLDIAIQGNGFFAVQVPGAFGGGTVYTRLGHLFVDAQNMLVADDDDGLRLVPNVAIPRGTTAIAFGEDGAITIWRNGSKTSETLGRIYVTTFEHPESLCIYPPTHHGFYAPPSAGKVARCVPGENGAGKLLTKRLEPHVPEPGRVRAMTHLVCTENDLDLAVAGDGFFSLKFPSAAGGYVGYVRSVRLTVNRFGQLSAADPGGAVIVPPISVPSDAAGFFFDCDGVLCVGRPTSLARRQIGRIQLTRFTNPIELGRSSTNREIRLATDGAGHPVTGAPGEQGMGGVLQYYLEEPSEAR